MARYLFLLLLLSFSTHAAEEIVTRVPLQVGETLYEAEILSINETRIAKIRIINTHGKFEPVYKKGEIIQWQLFRKIPFEHGEGPEFMLYRDEVFQETIKEKDKVYFLNAASAFFPRTDAFLEKYLRVQNMPYQREE